MMTVIDQAQSGHYNASPSTPPVPTQRLILVELQVISYLLHQAIAPTEDLKMIRDSVLDTLLTY